MDCIREKNSAVTSLQISIIYDDIYVEDGADVRLILGFLHSRWV